MSRLDLPQGTSVFVLVCLLLGHKEPLQLRLKLNGDMFYVCARCGKHA